MNGDQRFQNNMNLSSKPELSIVIPVFNEEAGIPTLVVRIKRIVKQIVPAKAEVLFVDDHSTDNSPALLRAACKENEGYRYLRLSRNSGSHIAILAGLENSKGDCAVFIAADLQDPPELIPKMLELWRKEKHVVWAVRAHREGISWIGEFLARTFYRLLNRFGEVKLPPQGSDFALLDRIVIDGLVQSASASPSLSGEIARLGFSQAQIPYTKAERKIGRSKWSFGSKLGAFADAFVLFSYTPLRVMSYLGMICSLLGFLYALVVIFLRLYVGTPIEGWASLMVVVLLLGGIQMIMLGVLGEYLWRTLEETRRRPRYFIEDAYGLETPRIPKRSGSQLLQDDPHD
jgi:glycosyltransferase involved in cell wall biosynthesis